MLDTRFLFFVPLGLFPGLLGLLGFFLGLLVRRSSESSCSEDESEPVHVLLDLTLSPN